MNFFLELSAISCQLSVFDFVTKSLFLKSHPFTPLNHPTPTLTLTRTLNWGGKDIILHHLTQMFLEKIPAINHLI